VASEGEAAELHFGKEWPTRHFYHLMLNSRLGDEVVIRTIVDEVSALS
jgi:hypothetical protein